MEKMPTCIIYTYKYDVDVRGCALERIDFKPHPVRGLGRKRHEYGVILI